MENTEGTTVTHLTLKAQGTVPKSDEAVLGGTDLPVHPCLGLGMQPDPAPAMTLATVPAQGATSTARPQLPRVGAFIPAKPGAWGAWLIPRSMFL